MARSKGNKTRLSPRHPAQLCRPVPLSVQGGALLNLHASYRALSLFLLVVGMSHALIWTMIEVVHFKYSS